MICVSSVSAPMYMVSRLMRLAVSFTARVLCVVSKAAKIAFLVLDVSVKAGKVVLTTAGFRLFAFAITAGGILIFLGACPVTTALVTTFLRLSFILSVTNGMVFLTIGIAAMALANESALPFGRFVGKAGIFPILASAMADCTVVVTVEIMARVLSLAVVATLVVVSRLVVSFSSVTYIT